MTLPAAAFEPIPDPLPHAELGNPREGARVELADVDVDEDDDADIGKRVPPLNTEGDDETEKCLQAKQTGRIHLLFDNTPVQVKRIAPGSNLRWYF